MVGGSTKRDEGLPAISSTNIFSALESRRKKSSKKKSDKEKSDSLSGKNSSSFKDSQQASQVWKPTPVSVTSWADCEDDDDFFATPAPPPMWSSDQPAETADAPREDLSQGEESEGEEEIEEEVDEENEDEPETQVVEPDDDVKIAPAVPVVAREPDRQLSKKELRKKGLAELDAVLAELGLNQKDENDDKELAEDTKIGDANGETHDEVQNTGSASALGESKSSKRRKAKKDKFPKEDDDAHLETDDAPKEGTVADDEDADTGPADPKEVLKKLASMKKKKSFKENDAAAKAAAAEAAARAARQAAAKKKEKSHYNQQPVR